FFHGYGHLRPGQGQRQFGQRRSDGARRAGTAQLAQQARYHAADLLLFRFVFWLLLRRLRQFQGRFELLAEFQDAYAAAACTGIRALRIQGVSAITATAFTTVAAKLEQQPGAALFQPFVRVGLRRDVLQDKLRIGARAESLAAIVQVRVVVDIPAAVKNPRRRWKLHFFINVQTQVGEDELGPVLAQVA